MITTDNVGNTFTSALVTNVRVDNTLPTNTLSLQSPSPAGSAFQNGNTIYYRGTAAGNFQLQNAVADAGSGPASSVFPALGGTVGTWTHTTQTVNTPAGGPYAHHQQLRLERRRDQQPHRVASPRPTTPATPATPPSSPSPTTRPTRPARSPHPPRARTSAATPSPSPPTPPTAAPASPRAQFQRSPAGAGTWTNIGAADTTSPYSVNWDTTAVADGLYDLRVITTDNVGNTFTSALVTNVRVDNTLPDERAHACRRVSPAGAAFLNGTTVYYRGTAAGNLQLQNAVADAGSGPASSIFPALGGTVGTWTHTTQTVNTPAGGPYVTTNNFAWNAGETNSPTESVTSTDNAGNTSNATVLTFTNDSTAPSVTAPLSVAGYYTSLSVPVTMNGGSDGGSGVAAGSSVCSATRQRCPAAAADRSRKLDDDHTLGRERHECPERQVLRVPRTAHRQRRERRVIVRECDREGRQCRPVERAHAHVDLTGRLGPEEREHDLLPRGSDGRRELQDP